MGLDSPNQGSGAISRKQSSAQRQRQARLSTVKQELTYPNDDPKGRLSQRIKSTVDTIVSQGGANLDIKMCADDDSPGKVEMHSMQRPIQLCCIHLYSFTFCSVTEYVDFPS